jgi:hypothetical protein
MPALRAKLSSQTHVDAMRRLVRIDSSSHATVHLSPQRAETFRSRIAVACRRRTPSAAKPQSATRLVSYRGPMALQSLCTATSGSSAMQAAVTPSLAHMISQALPSPDYVKPAQHAAVVALACHCEHYQLHARQI